MSNDTTFDKTNFVKSLQADFHTVNPKTETRTAVISKNVEEKTLDL